jgi:hypothetical protein
MKRRILTISALLVIGLSACNQKVEADKKEITTDIINNPETASGTDEAAVENLPAFEFDETVIEFGEISQGEKVKKLFVFKNTGKSNLIISDAKGSCGCTVPLWPKEPIAPGESGEIEVVFDSNGKQGRQHKTVTIIANTVPNSTTLAIKGDVLVPETKN